VVLKSQKNGFDQPCILFYFFPPHFGDVALVPMITKRDLSVVGNKSLENSQNRRKSGRKT
jgi:hypothetical protein